MSNATAYTWMTQIVTDYPTNREAKEALPGILALDDCIAGRAMPAADGKPPRVQAFFPDHQGPMGDGMRRVMVSPAMLAQCERGAGAR